MGRVIRGIIRYDGESFAGWQKQPDQRTVQGELERLLSLMAGQPIVVKGASRTDAGVHAFGQVFAFNWPDHLDDSRLIRSLSRMMGPEARVDRLEPAPEGFHPIADALGKRYAYSLCISRYADPFTRRHAWQVPWQLDLELLEHTASRLVGRRDFAGFQSRGSPSKTTVRTLIATRLVQGCSVGPIEADGLWRLELVGDGFLYHMARNIAGTLINIARGYLDKAALDERLESPGPFRGLTAPAHGLALLNVYYDPPFGTPCISEPW